MNILQINYEYPPLGGGGGVLSRHVADSLVEAGHRVTVLTSSFGGLAPERDEKGVRVLRLPVWGRHARNTASMLSMLSYHPLACRRGARLAGEGFDLVATYFAIPSGPAGRHVARRLGLPNVLFLLGGDVYDPSKRLSPHRTPLLRRVVRGVIRDADYVFAGSENTRRDACRYYGDERPIEVVPLSIQPFTVPARDRAALGVPADDLAMVTVGRLVARKNVGGLLEALARLTGRGVAASLYVIGHGPAREALSARAADLGISERVRWLGNVDDEAKARWLAASDVFVSTSSHEGFGLVFLEAFHCGLPVACYDRGGQVDFVQHEVNGLVSRLGDLAAFTDGLERLARDPAARRAMGEQARQDVLRYYASHTTKRYLEVFGELVARRRSGAGDPAPLRAQGG